MKTKNKMPLIRSGVLLDFFKFLENIYTHEAYDIHGLDHPDDFDYADEKMLENHGLVPTENHRFWYVADVNKMGKTLLEYEDPVKSMKNLLNAPL